MSSGAWLALVVEVGHGVPTSAGVPNRMTGARDSVFPLRLALPALLAMMAALAACHPVIKSTSPTPPTAAQMAQLWVQPDRVRDLYWGVGGQRLAPSAAAKYKVIEIKRSGFSQGYTVADKGSHWSVKFPPEAATEVVASRIHWGIGYPQPPIYYVEQWAAEKATMPNPQLPARFRETKPDFHGLKADGTWSYYHNPF